MSPELMNIFASHDNLAMLLVASVFALAIVGHTIRSVVTSITRERTRREIAAYIAEGSMSPEQGERLMTASNPRKS